MGKEVKDETFDWGGIKESGVARFDGGHGIDDSLFFGNCFPRTD